MFLGKMALSSKTPKLTLKILNLAIAAVVVGITGLVWLGPDAAEAAGRKVTLTWNEIITPSATTTTPFSAPPANAPCLVSVAEWEPLGSRVEIQFILLSRPSGTSGWMPLTPSDPQLLPGKATSASVDWGIVAPGFEYRHLFQLYTVKGKDGATRNHQLISEFSNAIPVTTSCGG